MSSSNYGALMPENVIGSQLRRIRFRKGLTQSELAARCCVVGFDISRGTLAKIEARVRCVSDIELKYIAKAVGVSVAELFESKAGK